jgi:hypothetical protein
MKQCKNCSNDFEPKHETRGHEQLYCSIKCRTEAYKKRTTQKHQDNEEKEPEAQSRISAADLQRAEHRINPMGNYIPNVNLEILEGKYQAKTEALEYKLRYEQVVKELEQCKMRIIELESELDEYEDDDENSNEGYLGSIMDLAKSSPELGNALGKLMQNEKVQNFILSIIPNTIQNQ